MSDRMPAVAIAWTSLATLVLCTARPAPRATERGGDRRIAAITICSPTGTGGVNGDCDGGTFDTQQVVLGPGGSTINDYGFGGATDEHSTVLPPGYLKDNSDYLFVVASGYKPVNRDIGAVVLSSSAPDANGQWVLQPADGYGVYPPDLGAVFLAPVAQGKCPPPNADTGLQDATFDLAYAAPGSVLKDPTSESGRLLMIYEGTNTCIGSPGGKNPGTGAYETIGVATSLDGGRSWPRYASAPGFDAALLPFADGSFGFPAQGPNAPLGAMGPGVCVGNDCPQNVPSNYGRYRVLSPPIEISDLIQTGAFLKHNVGNSEPSAFLDDVPGRGDHDGLDRPDAPYVYVVFEYVQGDSPPKYRLLPGHGKDVMVARAALDPRAPQLTFSKWNGTTFFDDGEGGLGAPILPEDETAFGACATASQERSQASISYVKTTQQYLLVFVCNSPGPPSGGVADTNDRGSAWFYATSDNLSDQSAWSAPREIRGSWAAWTQNQPPYSGCPAFNGFYPTLMSLGQAPGQLTTHGFVFYLWGALGACDDPKLDTGRRYTSRQFTIITAKRP